MEGLIKRTAALGTLFIVIGLVFAFTKAPAEPPKTEQWLLGKAPDTVLGTAFEKNKDTPGMSYRMDQSTYDTLQPYGIVSRVFTYKGSRFDTVLIASRSKNSFHDPRVCFKGAGWDPQDQEIVQIPTKTRGTVSVTFTKLVGIRDKQNQIAIFMYKGPDGFVPTTLDLKWSMFKDELLAARQADCVFYRFIPLDGKATKEELVEYVGQFLDEANTYSHGYF